MGRINTKPVVAIVAAKEGEKRRGLSIGLTVTKSPVQKWPPAEDERQRCCDEAPSPVRCDGNSRLGPASTAISSKPQQSHSPTRVCLIGCFTAVRAPSL